MTVACSQAAGQATNELSLSQAFSSLPVSCGQVVMGSCDTERGWFHPVEALGADNDRYLWERNTG